MSTIARLQRRLTLFGVLAVGLVLLTTLVGGFHHHADGGTHRDCAVCQATTTPSAPPTSVEPVAAPLEQGERIQLAAVPAAPAASNPEHHSRAPPES